MTTFNVLVGVVELIEADTEADAIRILSARVLAAGLETYEGSTDSALPSAFESDVDPEPVAPVAPVADAPDLLGTLQQSIEKARTLRKAQADVWMTDAEAVALMTDG